MLEKDDAHHIFQRLHFGIFPHRALANDFPDPLDDFIFKIKRPHDLPQSARVMLLQLRAPAKIAGLVHRIRTPGDNPALDMLTARGNTQGGRGTGCKMVQFPAHPLPVDEIGCKAFTRHVDAHSVERIGRINGLKNLFNSGHTRT